jgi:NodT family efflux transporter outer membrane factor (OMF) lipoprotein
MRTRIGQVAVREGQRSGRPHSALPALAPLLAVGVLGVGCTTLGPNFQKPEAPVAEEWIEEGDPEVSTKTADYSQWWTAFDDAVLDKLIETARRQNLPLQIAGLRILEARAELGIAVGNLYPQQQQANGLASANQLSENAPNSAAADRFFYNYEAGFDAAWEIDFWGQFRRGIESADASLIAEVANYDDVLVTLTSEVARTYVITRTFEERIAIARDNVKIQDRSLQIADVRFRNGATTELDVTQATTLLKNTESTIPTLETGLRQAQNALSTLLGMPPGSVRELLGERGKIPTAAAEVAVGVPAELLRRRPDIRRAELNAAAQSALIGVAEADLYPSFSLFGSIGLQASSKGGTAANDSKFNDLFSGDSLTYGVGPSFSWNILNYGRIKNNVRVQDARLQQLLVNYQNTVLSAAQEVEDSLVAFLNSQKRAEFLGQSVKASQRSVDLSLIQYREGATDYQRVLDSQQSLALDQDNWTVARGDIVLNLVATYKALGGGWELRKGEEFVPASTVEEMRQRTDWGKLLPPAALPETLDPPKPAAEEPLFPKPDW